MNTIAIDCGASFIKGARIDKKTGEIINKISIASPKVHGNEPVTDPVQITALVETVSRVINELTYANDEEIDIAFSTEMHGFILADEKGEPITDYISWQKEYGNIAESGQTSLDLLMEESVKDEIKKTGMPLRKGLPSLNLCYLLHAGIAHNNNRIYFYTLGDYLILRVFHMKPVCHLTNAAATGLADIVSACWNKQLIKHIGADEIVFPEIGERKTDVKWNAHVYHVYPAIGDQQAALLGAGVDDDNSLSFNLGTGAQVSSLSREFYCDGMIQSRPYFYGYYLRTIPYLPSGRALNVYFRFFSDVARVLGCSLLENELWDKLIQSENTEETEMLKFDLSFFANPITDHERGSISNISESNLTTACFIASIFEDMSHNYLYAADQLRLDRNNIKRIVFSGGIARRIQSVRNRICEKYPEAETVIAEDETLNGLYRYMNIRAKE